MKSQEFVERLGRARAVAILRCGDAALAEAAMEAAIAGGFSIVEFTLSIPEVYELLARFSPRPGLIVGAGTVLTVAEAERCLAAGARFLVSPVLDLEVVRFAVERDVAILPGVHTPTELLAAQRAGAPLQKLFPAPAGGPSYLKACLGPLPFLKVVPTNGITAENARAWLDAGAFAVGVNAAIFAPDLLARRDFAAITAKSRAVLAAVAG